MPRQVLHTYDRQQTPILSMIETAPQLQTSLASEPHVVDRACRAVVGLARHGGANESQLDRIRSAVTTALHNAIEDAYPGTDPDYVHLTAAIDGEELTVIIEGNGWGIRDDGETRLGTQRLVRKCDAFTSTPGTYGGVRVEMHFKIAHRSDL